MNESLKARATELVSLLKQGAQISRERNLNLDYAKVADDAADEIERLTNEAVAADIRIANDSAVIAGMTAERDEAKLLLVKCTHVASELNAKLAELAAQEPVGEVRNSQAYFYNGMYTDKTEVPNGAKLYAAAGAAPVYTHPPAVRELTEDQIFDIAHANEALFDRLAIEYQSRDVIALFRAIEAAVRGKP